MWRKRKAHAKPAVDAGAITGIGDECEAYLAGRLAVYLQHRDRPVPPVGWLNQLVHATPDELTILANDLDGHAIRPSSWRRTIGYLARVLLERARETDRSIVQLQQELLVPLELELIADPAAAGLDQADMIRLTLVRLYECPSCRPEPTKGDP